MTHRRSARRGLHRVDLTHAESDDRALPVDAEPPQPSVERRTGEAQLGGHAVHVRLGPLAGVVKEALLAAYDLAREGSPLAEAELVIEEVPIAGHCPACNATRTVESVQSLCCIACGTPMPQLDSGRELEVRALEIQ